MGSGPSKPDPKKGKRNLSKSRAKSAQSQLTSLDSNIYEIEVALEDGRLGVEVDPDTLQVQKIHDGALKKHNRKNPGKAVKVGDRFFEINGEKIFGRDEYFEALQKRERMQAILERQEPRDKAKAPGRGGLGGKSFDDNHGLGSHDRSQNHESDQDGDRDWDRHRDRDRGRDRDRDRDRDQSSGRDYGRRRRSDEVRNDDLGSALDYYDPDAGSGMYGSEIQRPRYSRDDYDRFGGDFDHRQPFMADLPPGFGVGPYGSQPFGLPPVMSTGDPSTESGPWRGAALPLGYGAFGVGYGSPSAPSDPLDAYRAGWQAAAANLSLQHSAIPCAQGFYQDPAQTAPQAASCSMVSSASFMSRPALASRPSYDLSARFVPYSYRSASLALADVHRTSVASPLLTSRELRPYPSSCVLYRSSLSTVTQAPSHFGGSGLEAGAGDPFNRGASRTHNRSGLVAVI